MQSSKTGTGLVLRCTRKLRDSLGVAFDHLLIAAPLDQVQHLGRPVIARCKKRRQRATGHLR